MLLDPNMTLSTLFTIAAVDVTIFLILSVVAWIGNSLIIIVTIKSFPSSHSFANSSFSDRSTSVRVATS
ncbi:hypothetical protein L596_014100 [Steinernema carpocapsae]|uniref:Uncharacterized protein n=1 Tax=Steinernema carpocapsae TaxID=34508 RepID=A0A4V6A2N9_STECR|nr:hypothetical protein L596_014100 [Steinernema carpocapsae]